MNLAGRELAIILFTLKIVESRVLFFNVYADSGSLNSPQFVKYVSCNVFWFSLRRKHQDQFSSVQSLSHVQFFATPWIAACQVSLSIINSRSLLKLMSITLVMTSNHLILCHPLLLPPSIFPSIRLFSNESVIRIRWPKYWSFSFSISPSNEYSGLISFRIDWMDLLATQETLIFSNTTSWKASILGHSAFFIVQLSHLSGYLLSKL